MSSRNTLRSIVSLLLFLTLPVNISLSQAPTGFYRVDGTDIVDSDGIPAMRLGIGLGGWLMPEGYMLDFPGGMGSATKINSLISDLIGENDTAEFWRLFREFYVTEKDVEQLVEWGFDHIRLPLHYNLFYNISDRSFIEDGFTLLDTFLGWCETYGIQVILDLHAAPGAQSDGEIADSDGTARLWTEPDPYQDMTVELWEEFARRYKDDTRIIGYDLINEPVTPDEIGDGAQALLDLYVRLTSAVRQIDTNHILFIEGNYFATTFDKLFPPFDEQMTYAFHKYWNSTDQGSIQYLLNMRTDQDRPLWLGETGENSNPWINQVVSLMADQSVGWNYWTHKQIQATVSPLSVPIQQGYREVLDYFHGWGPKPSIDDARNALFEQARTLHIDSARVNKGVLFALFESDFSTARRPFKEHKIPGIINAVEYDYGDNLTSYSDTDFMATSGSPGGGNDGGRYRNDGVDIEASTDPEGFQYNVGWMAPLEWMEYTVQVVESGRFDIELRVASISDGGDLQLVMDQALIANIDVPQTGGYQNWVSVFARDIPLDAGTSILKVAVGRVGGFNLNRITFTKLIGTGVDESGIEIANASSVLQDVYPVPAGSRLYIDVESQGPARVEITVFDVLGRVIMEQTEHVPDGKSTVHISTLDIPDGLAIVRMVHYSNGRHFIESFSVPVVH